MIDRNFRECICKSDGHACQTFCQENLYDIGMLVREPILTSRVLAAALCQKASGAEGKRIMDSVVESVR